MKGFQAQAEQSRLQMYAVVDVLTHAALESAWLTTITVKGHLDGTQLVPDKSVPSQQAGKAEHDHVEELPGSSSASETAADSVDADRETGVGEWRKRGLPPAQSKAQRWGAPYHMQFAILFTRWSFCPFLALSTDGAALVVAPGQQCMEESSKDSSSSPR